MNKTEINQLSDEKLICEFYWTAVKTTNEANSRRGLTKATAKKEEWLVEAVAKRFGLDVEILKKEINQ